MGHTLCIANQKGGVGKTTTAVNLSTALAMAEKKCLLVDFDPQGHATAGMGIDKTRVVRTLYDTLNDGVPVERLVVTCIPEFLGIIPTSSALSKIEDELLSKPDKATRLRQVISDRKDVYDYIIIDSPPSRGILGLNAMTAADALLIPLQCEYFALEGIISFLSYVKTVKAEFNPKMKIAGALLTMYDPEEDLSVRIAESARKYLNGMVLETVIPRNVHVRESAGHGKPLLLRDVKSRGAQSYLELARELMKRQASLS